MSRGSVGIVSQIGVEAVPGTAVPADKLLPTISLKPKPRFETQKYRAQGARTTTSLTQAKRMGEGEMDGVLDYNTNIWVWNGLFSFDPGVQIGALIAYRRLWNAGVYSSDMARKTYTIEKGDQEAADRYVSCQIKAGGFEATQDNFNIKGSMFGRYPVLNQVLTANPTKVAERPVERDDINLYIDDTFAAIGTTQVPYAIRESLDIGEKFKEAFFHNRAQESFTDIVEVPYEAMFNFVSAHNAQSRTIHASIKDNPKKYVRWEAIGKKLGTNGGVDVYEKIQVDMAIRFDKAEEMEDDGGVYGYDYACSLNDDADQGTHLIITCINALASM